MFSRQTKVGSSPGMARPIRENRPFPGLASELVRAPGAKNKNRQLPAEESSSGSSASLF
jgi:hypothetical protein